MDTPRAMQRGRRSQLGAGAALIVIGIVALALQYFQGPGRAVILLLAGGSFIAGYLYSDIYGLLIPGGILSGLGLGSLAEWRDVAVRDPNAVGLGIGFVAIYAVERVYRRRAHWWPLIPGLILVGVGLGARFGDVGNILWRWAPAILVVLGVVLVVRAIKRGSGVPTGPAS
jgi:hypothetical protein